MHFSSQQHEMLGCMFVTCIDICKHIIFTVQSDHHGTSIRFHFHVRLKPLCNMFYRYHQIGVSLECLFNKEMKVQQMLTLTA